MPLYEYVCLECESRFEELRSLDRMDDPASCPKGHPACQRVLSVFAAVSRNASGHAVPVSGGCGGGCTNCACSLN